LVGVFLGEGQAALVVGFRIRLEHFILRDNATEGVGSDIFAAKKQWCAM